MNVELLVLATVAEGPAHGYRIAEALRERSGGRFDLPEGTIYPALYKLEREGVLTSRWETGTGRRRRVYRLTRRGRTALARQRQEWSEYARAVESVLS